MPDKRSNKPSRKTRKGFNRFMKITRRVHMYLGLLLVPWVVLFGASGFLFNHNSTFWGGNVETLATFDSQQVLSENGVQAIDIDHQMETVLSKINASGKSNYSLHGSPWLNGHLSLSGKSGKENLSFKIDPRNGATQVTSNQRNSPKQEKPGFDKQKIESSPLDLPHLETRLTQLLAEQGIELTSGLTLPSRGSNAEIRFMLEDETGKLWRGSYQLATSTLSGVADDAESGMNLAAAMTRLHKTHHYPVTFGARWLWSLIGDITAISLVVWGISGLIMWWQIKPTRVIGAVSVFLAAIIALYIFSGTLDDYQHNPVQIRSR